jgi:hypothetical protein
MPFIDKHFQDFRHNKYIETAHPCDCTKRRRIDHRRCIGNTLICVETDERAYEGYSVQDERDRYHDAIMDWGGKLVFIRFNPDGKGFTMDEKQARLAEEINEQVRRVEAEENTELCERVYLFYPARRVESPRSEARDFVGCGKHFGAKTRRSAPRAWGARAGYNVRDAQWG